MANPEIEQQATAETGELSHRQVLTILSGLLLGVFLAAVDGTIVATALPTIVGELGGFDQLAWVVTSYLVTTTISTPIYGKLSDVVGRKQVFRFAVVTFVAASVLAGLAQSMNQLIAFRAIQGIGGGGLSSLAFIIISDIVSPRERGRYIGYFTGMFALSGLVGPLLGGLIVDSGTLSWRWIFFLNVPLGIITLVATAIGLRGLPDRRRPDKALDWRGALLLSIGVGALLLAASLGGDMFAWTSPVVLGLVAFGLVASAAFVKVETAAEDPVIPLRLFSNDIFAVGMAISVLSGASLMSANIFLPLFLQVVTGSSATVSGLVLTPMIVGVTVVSIVAGKSLTKTGRYKGLIRGGTVLALIGVFGMFTLSKSSATWHAMPWVLVTGMGMGMMMPPLSISIQNAVSFSDLGVATAANTFFRSLGQTFGVAAFGAVMAARLRGGLEQRLPEATLDELDIDELTGSPKAIRELAPELQIPVTDSVADAVHLVYVATIPVAICVVGFAFLLREIPLSKASPMAQAAAEAAKIDSDEDGYA